jgi:polyhydroxyalkanoate synthesis regulator phasin
MASAKSIIKKVLKREQLLAAGKANYQEADALLEEILKEAKAGQILTLPNGRQAEITDNLKGGNKIFKTVAVARYDVKISGASE